MSHHHYHYNVPGYMPEMDPYVCETLEDAQDCMKHDVEDILESENGDCDGDDSEEVEHEYHYNEPTEEDYKSTQIWLTRTSGNDLVFTIDGPCECEEGAEELESLCLTR